MADREPQTFFFRDSEGALFGCLHPARTTLARGTVVLCQPHGHEYTRAHRTFRQLAEHLAHAGYAVFRFDFYGNGDSQGTFEEGHLGRWLRDVAAAVQEGRTRSRCRRVCLMGARLGATLAWLAAAREGIADALVLWDPIVRGADYLAELSAGESSRRRALWSRVSTSPVDDESVEYIGFAYSRQLIRELKSLDLTRAGSPRVDRTLLVRTDPPGHGIGPRDQLKAHLPGFDQRVVPVHRMWSAEEDGLMLAPQSLLDSVRGWLNEAIP